MKTNPTIKAIADKLSTHADRLTNSGDLDLARTAKSLSTIVKKSGNIVLARNMQLAFESALKKKYYPTELTAGIQADSAYTSGHGTSTPKGGGGGGGGGSLPSPKDIGTEIANGFKEGFKVLSGLLPGGGGSGSQPGAKGSTPSTSSSGHGATDSLATSPGVINNNNNNNNNGGAGAASGGCCCEVAMVALTQMGAITKMSFDTSATAITQMTAMSRMGCDAILLGIQQMQGAAPSAGDSMMLLEQISAMNQSIIQELSEPKGSPNSSGD